MAQPVHPTLDLTGTTFTFTNEGVTIVAETDIVRRHHHCAVRSVGQSPRHRQFADYGLGSPDPCRRAPL
jgi:hypothetical protein